jgi:hypothetical protein
MPSSDRPYSHIERFLMLSRGLRLIYLFRLPTIVEIRGGKSHESYEYNLAYHRHS